MPGGMTKPVQGGRRLASTTLRNFNGGLNIVDDDMNLSAKYLTVSRNCFVDASGNIQVRYGYKLFSACAAYISDPDAWLVNMEYFNGSLVVVVSTGEILRVLGDGSVQVIWNNAIAGQLPGAPAGWSNISFASFTKFNGHLIICNGVDKPLDIYPDFTVEYLQDAATNTNINVPVCRYVVACQRYLVMAGDPLYPNRVHISARDAAGTWAGDPPPNDATAVDVGSVVEGASTIRGILTFRDRLLVLFVEGIVIGTLGTYNTDGGEAVHEPNFDDGIKGFGSVSHRAAIAQGDDGLMCDLNSVPSLKRTVFSGALKPESVSYLVDPLIADALSGHSLETLEDRVFAIFDKIEGQYTLFVPNTDFTETKAFVYSYRPALKQEGWAVFDSWNFTCAAKSLEGRIFFGDADCNIWVYGNRADVITVDKLDLITEDGDTEGQPIEFEWELPWGDFGDRTRAKNSKYISFDTRGTGEFTCSMRVDNFQQPALSMDFSCGEQPQYGGGTQTYGGGRNTSYKKLYAWPAKFTLAKLRVTGSTERSDVVNKFVSLSVLYQRGGFRA